MSKIALFLAALAAPAALAQSREAEAKAKSRALLIARMRDEAKCRKGKDVEKCLAAVAATYESPQLPVLAEPEPIALTPLVAPAPESAAAQAAAGAGTAAVADATAPAPAPVLVVTPAPVPVPEADPVSSRPARSAEVINDLQLGPQSLLLDSLLARAEILPGSLQLAFGYRLVTDDATAPHHLFLLGLESSRCLPGDACGLRWFVRGGLGPHNDGDYTVDRRVNGTMGAHRDSLGWSASVLQAGLGYVGARLSFGADAQLEGLIEEYLRNLDLVGPQRVTGSLDQLRLRGTLGLQGRAFTLQARVAGYVYDGDATSLFKDMPMRGALIEDDLPGLAGALQSFSARLEGRWELRPGTALALSYGYLSYVGPTWSSAHIFGGQISQRFGRFRIGLGLVAEQELDAQGNGYPTLFGTGSLGAAF